jgi:hypothetical protein
MPNADDLRGKFGLIGRIQGKAAPNRGHLAMVPQIRQAQFLD